MKLTAKCEFQRLGNEASATWSSICTINACHHQHTEVWNSDRKADCMGAPRQTDQVCQLQCFLDAVEQVRYTHSHTRTSIMLSRCIACMSQHSYASLECMQAKGTRTSRCVTLDIQCVCRFDGGGPIPDFSNWQAWNSLKMFAERGTLSKANGDVLSRGLK